MVKGKLVGLAPMDRGDGEGQVLTPVVACKKNPQAHEYRCSFSNEDYEYHIHREMCEINFKLT
jgi:hypothetical protein